MDVNTPYRVIQQACSLLCFSFNDEIIQILVFNFLITLKETKTYNTIQTSVFQMRTPLFNCKLFSV